MHPAPCICISIRVAVQYSTAYKYKGSEYSAACMGARVVRPRADFHPSHPYVASTHTAHTTVNWIRKTDHATNGRLNGGEINLKLQFSQSSKEAYHYLCTVCRCKNHCNIHTSQKEKNRNSPLMDSRFHKAWMLPSKCYFVFKYHLCRLYNFRYEDMLQMIILPHWELSSTTVQKFLVGKQLGRKCRLSKTWSNKIIL